MANKPRKYVSAESLGVDTSALATDTTKVTATFTPDASSTYLYIWSCDVAGSGITLDSIVTLKNNAGSTLSTTNHESKDLTADWATLSGIAFETFGASPTSQSVTLTWRAETTSLTSSIRNARIVAIKLNSTDAFVENTADVTNATTTLAAATTLTFTPPSTGNYLILGSCETKTPALTASVISQITYNSTAYSAATNVPNDITNYISGLLQASVGSLTATSKTITLDFARVAGTGTVNCRRARLVALRLDEITDSSITIDNTLSSTTSTSYVTKTTTGAISTTTGMTYLVVGTASIAGDSTTISVGHGLSVDGVYASESFQESALAGTLASAHFGAIDVITAGTSTTVNFNYYTESASINSYTDEVTLSVLALDATDLYWVGGTGSWDATTATRWSLTSGGTGGAAVPTSGTNVIFDSASDSAAPFTVTVGTGAVCNNLTASGLDQTMTLSGSTAMSIYGNLSVPATNFTQSYTGTITFAGTGSETITTNGKTFTAFTFDGVGGTFTLQDALTLSGTATLTRGTLALSSYTFTCLTFSSDNANARTINFGTGKIVGTSAANSVNVWNTATPTNLTISGTSLVELTGGGAAATKYVSTGTPTEANAISFTFSTTAGGVVLQGSVKDITIANNVFTFYVSTNATTYGNFTVLGTNPTITVNNLNAALIFAATSGTKTITTNGKTLDIGLTFNGVGGTWALQDALTITSAGSATLTNGTLSLGSYTFSSDTFASNNTNVRTINFGTGKIVITSAATATVWTTTTINNLTVSGTPLVELTGGGATTKTISAGALSEANSISFTLSTTAGTVAFTASNTVRNLIIANNSFTLSNVALTIYGSLTINGTLPTLTAGANIWTFAGTSGSKTITTNGETLDFPITFNGVGSTWGLQSALTVGTTTQRDVTLSGGTIELNSYTFSMYGRFICQTNLAARRIQMSGTGGKIVVTLDTAAIIISIINVGFTSDGNVLFQTTGGNAATTKEINVDNNNYTEANLPSLQVSNTAGSVTIYATLKNLTIDNNSITITNTFTPSILGNFTISGTTPTFTGGLTSWTFKGAGIQTITTNGKTLDFPIFVNGTGTFSLGDNFTLAASRTFTLTAGTLELNSFTLSLGNAFSSSNSNTRRIQMSGTGGKIEFTVGGSLTIWTTTTTTNMTTDGNVLVYVNNASVLGARTIDAGALSEANAISFQTNVNTTFTANNTVKNLTIDNIALTITNVALTIYGNLSIGGTSPTLTAGTNTWTFAATSGTKTITTNGETIDFPIIFNGVGGTWQLQDALTIGATRLTTLTAGTFGLNGYTCTAAGGFTVTGSGTKVLAHGTADLVISLAGATAFNATGATNLTSTGTGKINMTSATAKTFVGNGNSYATLNQGGAGALTITGSNTFQNITNSVQPATVLFTAGTTNTFTNDFDLNGTSGNLITINSVTAASTFTLSKASGTVDVSFCSIKDSIATGGAAWYAGTTSTNGGNNTGWLFTAVVLATGAFLLLF
jgi:hypothetical protein